MTVLKIVLAAALLCLASQARASDAEENYIRTRDEFLHHSEKRQDPKTEKKALNDLEEQLRTLIGSSQMDGFSAPGTITLESLDTEEPGSDQLDGLRYAATSGEIAVVTTPRLLENFLERHPKIPRAQSKVARDGTFLSAVIDWDAGFWNFDEIPVRAKANSAAYASLIYVGQDTLLHPPNWIVIFVATASRVIIMSKGLTDGVTQIPACGDKWVATQTSMSDAQFEAYASCWRRHAKDQTFFRALQSHAQSLVDRAEAPPATASTFEAYPAKPDFDKVVMPPFKGEFRTRIREGFKAGPRFAGHYVLFGIGCGAECVFYTVGDLKTGETFPFPLGEEKAQLDLVFKPTSRLVRAQWEDRSGGLDNAACVHEDFAWTGKAFERLDTTRVAGECRVNPVAAQ